jgi:hypothetical protein
MLCNAGGPTMLWMQRIWAVRFSVVTRFWLAIAGFADVGLTVEIVNQPSQRWPRTLGQILIANVVVFVVVAPISAYNRFGLIPLPELAVDLCTDRPRVVDEGSPVDVDQARMVDSSGSLTAATLSRMEATGDRISRTLWLSAHAEVVWLICVIGFTARLVGSSVSICWSMVIREPNLW